MTIPNYYCLNLASYPCQPVLPPVKYPPTVIRPPVPTYAPPSDDTCNSAKYKYLIGTTYDPSAKTFNQDYTTVLTADKLPKPNIIITPGTITTMEFVATRLRVYYDDNKKNIVNEISCG